jgi:ABC-type sugar transport system ATPase subunit
MVGREVTDMFPKAAAPIGDTVLAARHMSVDGAVNDVSLSVRRGEILGIGGLVGAGRTELVKSLFGAIPGCSGEIYLQGRKIEIRSPEDAVRHGLAFVPENRRDEGLLTEFSIEDNIGLTNLWNISKHYLVNTREQSRITADAILTMNIKAPSGKQIVKNLSGGNQQKVVLGRWFSRQPSVIIFDEPTRGIDVGAKAEIYRKIGDLVRTGVAVIIVSSELPELMGISDRILVLNKGRMTAEFKRSEFAAERIMLAATATSLQ